MSRARDTADQINRINSSAADATAITVDSSENVMVGKTSSGLSSAGISLLSTGRGRFTFDGFEVLELNRLTSDGDIVKFFKDGSNVGSIGTKDGDMYLGTGDTGLRFHDGNNQVYPTSTTTGTSLDATVDLGHSGGRFKDAYLSGGVYLGGTGSANKLDDYEEGLWSPGLKGASSGNVATLTSATKGSYVKIGNQVTVNFIVVTSSIGSASGTVQITGLPFTVAAPLTTTGIQGNGTAGYWQGFDTAVNNIVYTAEGNTNLLYVYGTTSGTQNSISGIQINQMGAAAVRGTITYRST